MYRFVATALFCVAAHAAPTAVPQKPPVAARATEVTAPAELIKTVSAGTRIGAETPRDKRSAPVAANEKESKPGTRNMVLAALALMVGIAVRRYGVGK